MMNSTSKTNNNRHLILILLGVIVSCFLVTICVVVIGLATYFNISESNSSSINEVPAAFIEIEVDKDGCSVVRGSVQGDTEVDSLTWVIQDQDGYSVLERNAENEYRYRYFSSGTYSVHIKAWYSGSYHQISKKVFINCK